MPMPEVHIKLDLASMTLGTFVARLLKGQLGLVEPEVELHDDGKVSFLGEEHRDKTLCEIGLRNGSVLLCFDDLVRGIVVQVSMPPTTSPVPCQGPPGAAGPRGDLRGGAGGQGVPGEGRPQGPAGRGLAGRVSYKELGIEIYVSICTDFCAT